MRLSHRVALNGVQLDSIDNRILVQGVEEAAGKDQISTVSLFGGSGQRITNQHRDSLDVTVRFSINIKKTNMQARNDVFEKVCAWAAGGGWLTLNYKAGRRLHVVCAQLPAAGDMWSWTTVYAIIFRACGVPYWQQDAQNSIRADGSNITRQIGVGGNVTTVLDTTFRCNSGTCSSFRVTAGSSMIELTGLSLSAGQTLVIDHTADGLLRITAGGVSALSKRTAASSDDLYVEPGTVTVAVETQGSGTLTISNAGRYA